MTLQIRTKPVFQRSASSFLTVATAARLLCMDSNAWLALKVLSIVFLWHGQHLGINKRTWGSNKAPAIKKTDPARALQLNSMRASYSRFELAQYTNNDICQTNSRNKTQNECRFQNKCRVVYYAGLFTADAEGKCVWLNPHHTMPSCLPHWTRAI